MHMHEIKSMTQDFYKVMEIYFEKQIIFPYMYLEEIQEHYKGLYDDCNIYMLMLRDKLEMVKVTKGVHCLKIKYKNICAGVFETKKLYYKHLFGRDICPTYINACIQRFGEELKIEVNKKAFDSYENLLKNINDEPETIIFNVYDVMNICAAGKEIIEKYDVIYIGQSNPEKEYRTIFDRLRKHEKVAEVFREYNLEYRDKELVVFVLGATTKLNNISGLFFLGTTQWKECDFIGDKIDDSAIIDITEAMLIYHFKPKYNIRLKDSIPSIDKKVYRQILNAGLNQVQVGLNLYLQTFRNHIVLNSEKQKTVSKLRILKCNIDSLYANKEKADIFYNDIEDKFYGLLQG